MTAPLCALGVLTVAGPAIAAAEWNSGQFESCTNNVDVSFMAGDITSAQHIDLYQQCCRLSGGQWTPRGPGGLGVCGAPPAIAASTPAAPPQANAPEVPEGMPPPPTPTPTPKAPKTTFAPLPVAPVP